MLKSWLKGWVFYIVLWLVGFAVIFLCSVARAEEYTDDQIATAIYYAEGGAKTSFPYGILTHYKHTTPRQACINTIRHARKDWNGKGEFLEFLQKRYCPINCDNDNGTNKFWLKNVKYFLRKGAK